MLKVGRSENPEGGIMYPTALVEIGLTDRPKFVGAIDGICIDVLKDRSEMNVPL